MQILVLGGTVFLSRTMVQTALENGHAVTCFHRGRSGEPVNGAEVLHGDRGDPAQLAQLSGRHFDLVFDTGYEPALVRASAQLLQPQTDHYTFISSINAFPGWPEQPNYQAGGVHDGDPDAGTELPADVGEEAAYGWRKVGAERAVQRSFGTERSSILRAGCIVGPQDTAGRLPWWIDRIERGGDVLAPGDPDDVVRVIDARDIAEFALLRAAGTFEVTGPAHQVTRGELFETIRELTGSRARLHWIADDLLEGRVDGWTEVPLWVARREAPSLFAHDTTAAEAAGLRTRPISETVRDVHAWMRSLPSWQPSPRTPGLDPDKERALLAELG